MDLPINPPVAPMLAKAVASVPDQPAEGPTWSYEPKWDGFRALIFRDGDEVVMVSRGGKDLARYFPELVEAARAELPERVVVDGEVGVVREIDSVRRLDWDSLSQRIHPAASRIEKLSLETPAIFIGFDALALEDIDLTGEAFTVRRDALRQAIGPGGSLQVSRVTQDPVVADQWFTAFEGAGLDGVVAKRLDGLYVPNKREMVKIKHKRTADCVVLGYRVHKSGTGLGSMLLGLYGDDGELRMVGGSSAFSDKKRIELQEMFEPMRLDPDCVAQGEVSRWRTAGSSEWLPVRQELVVEVAYDQMENGRFRHTVKFVRWRPDRDPSSCGYDQLEVPLTYDIHDVLEGTDGE
ncbi:ATP-dependent DNA ligase [Gordonia sp. HY002]|uniref:ATP-dependent DNA ligase n=1 Tax=Gordonia zhenghanii TaxID=2911516 RepID=UPI001EF0FDE4|nr:ATP-dependent DNA ligase [Gordonia zhenghanii]MCF8571876.1 ATP-dependent DNA ligase [Gordonia zhenghanii]MCF8604411.1 ATP-dependent DNA ligase [Gordonia zhenghanii]